MKKLINTRWVAFAAVSLFLASCNNTPNSSDNSNTLVDSTQKADKPTGDNSQTSLDWPGTYEGTVPCADCEGIKTTITLNNDNTFSRTEEYLGKKGKPVQDNGTFEWDEEKNGITLKDKDRNQKYKVGENQLFHLDRSGKVITGDLADKYILRRKEQTTSTNSITDKKWKLASIMGKAVKGNADDFFIIFHSKENRIETQAGCNRMNAGFTISDVKISITRVVSTMMACPDNTTETDYAQKLEEVDNFKMSEDGNKLQLNTAKKTVIEYELVK